MFSGSSAWKYADLKLETVWQNDKIKRAAERIKSASSDESMIEYWFSKRVVNERVVITGRQNMKPSKSLSLAKNRGIIRAAWAVKTHINSLIKINSIITPI